jgi:hypothetical protein
MGVAGDVIERLFEDQKRVAALFGDELDSLQFRWDGELPSDALGFERVGGEFPDA